MGNFVSALKKAHQAQAIIADSYNLQKFHAKFENGGKARMNLVAVESKYVPKYDKRDAPEGTQGAGNLGMRTKFILASGETIGTMSNGAHSMFAFFANLMGYTGHEQFNHIDFKGNVQVDVAVIDLGNNKSTYQFEVVEEGSHIEGFSNYLPSASTLFLDSGEAVNADTGEITDEPEVEAATETGKKQK